MEMGLMIDLLLIICGFYMIYCAVIMKWKGVLTKNVIVAKDGNVDKIKDKEGLIKYLFPKLLALGIIIVISCGVNIANDKLNGPIYVTYISCGVFFAALIVYCVFSKKAYNLFG